jgi:hypothetical protein
MTRIEKHEKCIRILEAIQYAHRKIEVMNDNKKHLHWFPELARENLKDIARTQAAIARLETYYTNTNNEQV